MFRVILPNSFYVDTHGSLCKILRTTPSTVHYQRNGHNRIASMMRFNADFEYVDGAELKQIWADIETTEHIKRLRAMQKPIKPNSPAGLFLRLEINACE